MSERDKETMEHIREMIELNHGTDENGPFTNVAGMEMDIYDFIVMPIMKKCAEYEEAAEGLIEYFHRYGMAEESLSCLMAVETATQVLSKYKIGE